VDGASSNSGRRAWRITGDYGVGKSSFALFLAQYFVDPKSRQISGLLKSAEAAKLPKTVPMIPILVTGEREGLGRAIARGIRRAFGEQRRGRSSKSLEVLLALAEKLERSQSTGGLQDLLDLAQVQADLRGCGILLILDEMGKFLEHAANRPESEDIFVLQTVAERAVRSGRSPFIFVGMLHQGFQAYSERLPFAQRHEWDKVAGRFEEIVFDQPLVHTAMLTSRALGTDVTRLPKSVVVESNSMLRGASACGWFGRSKLEDVSSVYPLHPTLLPVLVRFFARFGQHERSLFGFLLSNEPFGLQLFSESAVSADRWYRLSDFFDYVRAVYGHRLTGESYRSSWLRLIEIVDRAHNLSDLESDIAKTIALLNLIDAEDLAATDAALISAIGRAPSQIEKSLRSLVGGGVLFRRGQAGGYRLWGTSSVNLQAALQEALTAVEETKDFAAELGPYLEKRPIAARRHYLSTGTLRYFDVKYVAAALVAKAADLKPDGDGAIVIALPQTESERSFARADAERSTREAVIVVIPEVLSGLNPVLRDVKAWQHVISNTAELADDPFALAEAERQLRRCSAKLVSALEEKIGLRSSLASGVEVFRQGKRLKGEGVRRLSLVVSETCDGIYTHAPKISNELLNRNSLSSAAAAARMRLIEGMFTSPDKPLLGIDEVRAPPEKSMYLSVLAAGNVHRSSKGRHYIEEPLEGEDCLNLRPALLEIMALLDRAKGARIEAEAIFDRLRGRPFGVREGVIPLLLAIVTSTRAHEIAVYENGTFLHNFGPAEFLRLTKQPAGFELQLCRVVGIRAEVFRKLFDCFATEKPFGRQSELLDVVTPLCRFAAQLPEFTRRTAQLDEVALRVRNVLLTSTDPLAMLFTQLPEACGIKAFDVDSRRDIKRTKTFVTSLHDATNRLRDAYPALLTEIVNDFSRAMEASEGSLDRARIASRGSRVALAAREGKLKAFAQRLRDPGLSEDAWIEAIASFVASKPPSRWVKNDLDDWRGEIEALGRRFLSVEATAFADGPEPSESAVKVAMTRADGTELARVIDVPDETILKPLIDRVAVLYRLLWDTFGGAPTSDSINAEKETRSKG
jgi:hypothetical protein